MREGVGGRSGRSGRSGEGEEGVGAVSPRRVPSAPLVDVGVGELPHLFAHELPIRASVHRVHLQRREEREEREERCEVRREGGAGRGASELGWVLRRRCCAAAVRAAAAAHHERLL